MGKPRSGFIDVVRDTAKRTGLPMKTVEPIMRATFESIKKQLDANQKVIVPKFGIFYTTMSRAYSRTLPNKQTIWLKARHKLRFKWNQRFKKYIEGKTACNQNENHDG